MAFVALTTPIVLPWPLQSGLEAAARALLESDHLSHIDFSRPTGEAALVSPDSVSCRCVLVPAHVIEPCLPSTCSLPPSGDRWLHENQV